MPYYWLKLLLPLPDAVAAQQVGQVLGEGGAGHNSVASRLDGLDAQVVLQVGEEADDGGALLELCLQLGDEGEGLGVGVIEVEDDQAWPVRFLAVCELGDRVLVVLDEGDLDAQLARGLGDLGVEEEVFDEEEYPGWRVVRYGDGAADGVVDGLGVADVAA